MTIVLSGLLIVGTSILLLRSHRAGLVAYIVLSLTAPHCDVAGLTIPFEILAFPLVGLVLLLRIKTVRLRWLHYAMLAYLVVFTLATYITVLRLGPNVEWIRYASLFRYIPLLIALDAFLDRSALRTALVWALGINLLFAIVQVLVPGSVMFFTDMYGKESHVVLAIYSELGAIPRAVGSFGSPVDLAVLCLVSVSIFYMLFMSGDRSRYSIVAMAAATAAGLMSLTKLFILGLPLMFLVCSFALVVVGRRSLFRIAVGQFLARAMAVAAIIVVGVYVVEQLDARGFRIASYLEYLDRPLDAFATRYDRDDGVLGETIGVVKENLVLGVGSTRVKNEFVGDSTYVSLMHDAGIVGAIVVAIVALGMVAGTFRRRDDTGFVTFVALMVTGLAVPTLFSLEGAVFLAYALGPRGPTSSRTPVHSRYPPESAAALKYA